MAIIKTAFFFVACDGVARHANANTDSVWTSSVIQAGERWARPAHTLANTLANAWTVKVAIASTAIIGSTYTLFGPTGSNIIWALTIIKTVRYTSAIACRMKHTKHGTRCTCRPSCVHASAIWKAASTKII